MGISSLSTKKRVVVGGGILLAVGLVGFATVIFWTQTPFGTLDPLAAVGLRLVYQPPDIQHHSAAELRKRYLAEEPISSEYPEYVYQIKDTVAATADNRSISLRLYYPSPDDHLPVVVYYHGGGFVFGTLNEYNLLCAKLAQKTGALVISVDYRLAPEYPYPTPSEDAYAALRWIYHHASSLRGDSSRMAVAGDSAGGNLAAVVSLMARDSGMAFLDYQILLYPATQSVDLTTESHLNFGTEYGLTTRQVAWYIDQYLPEVSDRYEAYASPLLADDLSGLPPALVVLAGFDPLRTEGEQYADRLRAAGVPVTLHTYESMIHGFANVPQFRQADEVLDEVADALNPVF